MGRNSNNNSKIKLKDIRIDKSNRTCSSKSFGIGLSIAKTLIKNYNGEISIESEISKGIAIYIKL